MMRGLPDLTWLIYFGLFGMAVAIIGGLGVTGWAVWYIARAIAFYNGWA